MASLAGKVVSITGAASGMGAALARLTASKGARLALADLRKAPLEEMASELRSTGAEVTTTVVDVGSETEVDRWINDSVKHFGRLDGAANVAGILPMDQRFVDTTNELWDRVLRTNLYGVMHCVRAQLRVMGRGASIVNYASVAGISGHPDRTVYAISKHGVVGLTKSVAREIGPHGIRVNAIAPGPIKTPMTMAFIKNVPSHVTEEQVDAGMAAIVPLGRWGQPEEVARLTTFLLSDESSYMTGHVTVIDGGYD